MRNILIFVNVFAALILLITFVAPCIFLYASWDMFLDVFNGFQGDPF